MRTKSFLSLLSKHILGLFLSLIGIASIMPTVLAQSRPTPAPSTCSLTTLKGNYGFQGLDFFTGGVGTDVGILTFDGAGNVTGSDTAVTSSIGAESRTFSGRYTVNANCTGSFRWDIIAPSTSGPVELAIVIVNGGQKIYFMITSPSIQQSNFVAEKL